MECQALLSSEVAEAGKATNLGTEAFFPTRGRFSMYGAANQLTEGFETETDFQVYRNDSAHGGSKQPKKR